MKLSNGQKIAAGVALAIGLQLVAGISAYRAASAYFQAAAERRVCYRTLQANDDFQSLIKDAETGQRGYLLTGEESYLKPFEKASAALPAAMQELRETATESHESRFHEIEMLTQQKLAELRETIHARRSDPVRGQAAALEIVRTNAGKKLMDRIRAVAGSIDEAEQSRAQELSARMDDLLRGTLVRMFQLSTAAVVLVALAGVLVYRDLQRRLGVEERFQEQSSILQSILDSMSDAVFVANTKGEMTMVNAAARRMHGLDKAAGPTSEWSNYYRAYEVDRHTPFPSEKLPLVRAIRGEIVDNTELFTFVPQDANPPSRQGQSDNQSWGERPGIFLGISGRPIIDERGTLRGGVVVSRDITLQKLAELKILQQNEELERRVKERTAELARTNTELLQKNQENEMFVYSVSHDLRSPLVNLQGFSQELQLSCNDLRSLLAESDIPAASRDRGMRVLDGDVTQAVKFIQSAVMRLANIINALLRLSRAGRVEYQREQISLKELIDNIVTSRHSEIAVRDVQVEVGSLPHVAGDAAALEQLFSNLIDNALKYLDPSRSGKIVVGTMAGDPETDGLRTCFVRDNGLGIPEQGREKVFKAFERLHPQVATGEGMGLAIVARIVERHAGRIRLESRVGEGSTFYIDLPSEVG